MEKTCKNCGKIASEMVFAKFTHRDGRLGRRNVCHDCRSTYQIKNYERLKEYRQKYNAKNRTKKRQNDFDRRMSIKAKIDKIKSNSACMDCGGKFPSVCMDFDHIRHKNKSIANMVSVAYKIDLILKEIEVCEIVCANCHRVRTANRRQNLFPRAESRLTVLVR